MLCRLEGTAGSGYVCVFPEYYAGSVRGSSTGYESEDDMDDRVSTVLEL